MSFGGDDLEWTSNLSSRLLRFAWLFLITMSLSAYTANLASFFIGQGFEVLGPQDMTALKSSTVCIPSHGNDEAGLQRRRNEYGVGSLMHDLITAYMPADFANKTTAQRQACCWSRSIEERITRCAEKVRAGEADAILASRVALNDWLLNRTVPGRCQNFTWSPGVIMQKANPKQVVSRILLELSHKNSRILLESSRSAGEPRPTADPMMNLRPATP